MPGTTLYGPYGTATADELVRMIVGLTEHLRDEPTRHKATQVSTAPITGLSGTNVQAMLASAQANINASGTAWATAVAAEATSRSDADAALTAYVNAAVATLAPLASPTLTGTPLAPTATPGTNTTQIATTAFVAAAVAAAGGGSVNAIKDPVRAATTTALPASTVVGNVATANANGALPAIDGVSLSVGDRLLRKDAAALGAAHVDNGIWVVTNLGSGSTRWVLTRATDANSSSNFKSGMRVAVTEGTVNGGTSWSVSTTGTITPGTTAVAFVGAMAGALKTTCQPGQTSIPYSIKMVNAEASKGAWERVYTGNSFGPYVDFVEAEGYNVSLALPGEHSFGRVREATYHPGGFANLLWIEEYGYFRMPGGAIDCRPGYGMVTSFDPTNPTVAGHMICNIDADEFTFRSVTNGTGTWTPANKVFDFGFNAGGFHFNPGTFQNPSYSFNGHSAQVPGSDVTYFYLGFGAQDGSSPGLLWALSGPRQANLYLKGQALWTWGLQGPSNDIPYVGVGNAQLGGVFNVVQPPAGSGHVRGIVIRASATWDEPTLEVRKSDDSQAFAVDPSLVRSLVNVTSEKNLGIGATSPSYGGGLGVGFIAVATTVPTSNPTSGFIYYVDPADNALKARGSAGTITTLAAA